MGSMNMTWLYASVSRAPRSRDPTRLLKCAQLWSCSSIISASELFVDHVEGVEHDSTIRLMVEARLGTLNGRVEVKYSIVLWSRNAKLPPDPMSLLLLNVEQNAMSAPAL